jgi:hypothetical protein
LSASDGFYMSRSRAYRLSVSIVCGVLAAGLLASAAAAGEPARSALKRPRILQAQHLAELPPIPPEPMYGRPIPPPAVPANPATTRPAAPTPEELAETPRPMCPPMTPLTLRPTPLGDGYGRMVCHLSFTGDAYSENWRLENWTVTKKYIKGYKTKLHAKTFNHSLWAEGFWCGLVGKAPNGYVHDTSGWALKSYGTPQPGDPTIPYVAGATALVYDYGQYIYQPSTCAPGGSCPPDMPLSGEQLPLTEPVPPPSTSPPAPQSAPLNR